MESDERASELVLPCSDRPTEAWRGSQISNLSLLFKVSVLSHLTRHPSSMQYVLSIPRSNATCHAQITVHRADPTGNGLLFRLSLMPSSQQTPQADKPATPPSGYTRGLFESGVSVSRLVSWHFRGLERQCHLHLGVEGFLHACKTKSKDLHSTYSIRHQANPLASVSPCVPTYPL